MNKYFKNFILCGDADYHCLLCHENFQSVTDVEKHIRWEKHRKILKEQTLFTKFKKDFIYKISDGYYYCEACNCTSPVSEVTAHIRDEKHKANKETPIPDKQIENAICRYNCGYVIVSNIIVTELQWHSIVNRVCLICCKFVEPVKAKEHTNSTSHVLNIINAKVLKKNQDDYYRKIDDETFYCFICKNTVSYETFESHWTDQEHCDNKNTVVGRVTASDVSAEQKKKTELAKKLIDTQRAHFDVDETNETASCKVCKVVVKLEFKTMLDHQKSHGDAVKTEAKDSQVHGSSDEDEPEKVVYMAVQDHGKRRSELSKYGKENRIKLNEGGSRGYCSLCHTSLSASMRVFKEHVKGARHKGHLELKGLRGRREHKVPKAKCVPIVKYLDTVFYSSTMRVVWVNTNVCFDVPGFVLMAPVRKPAHFLKTKCFVCDVVYTDSTEAKHYQTEEHKRRFLAAKVVVEKADEFVREIRPDLYHCAICNKVLPFWELMDKHLNTWRHFQRKNNAEVVQKLLIQWYKDEVLTKCSKNPDILYVQTLNLGLFS
ncbi:hypothetical protein evm_007125 [Chilo suppressalis]|nr:hypothetical protein evm_007125 [Chilo suppressalis]